MGQQQLLLIVLGVIIVGIAVVVGINVFTASSKNANRDAIISDLTTIAAMAQQYYRKPIAMGGGSNSFDGSGGAGGGVAWSVPTSLQQTANMGATVDLTITDANNIILTGHSTEMGADGATPFTVVMNVDRDQITSTTFTNF